MVTARSGARHDVDGAGDGHDGIELCRELACEGGALGEILVSRPRRRGSASTPRVEEAAPATALTSLMLPRMTVMGRVSMSSEAVAVRSAEAPAPTGSSTMACSSFGRALAGHAHALDGVLVERADVKHETAGRFYMMTSTSSGSSLMMGEPPHASSALAQSLSPSHSW